MTLSLDLSRISGTPDRAPYCPAVPYATGDTGADWLDPAIHKTAEKLEENGIQYWKPSHLRGWWLCSELDANKYMIDSYSLFRSLADHTSHPSGKYWEHGSIWMYDDPICGHLTFRSEEDIRLYLKELIYESEKDIARLVGTSDWIPYKIQGVRVPGWWCQANSESCADPHGQHPLNMIGSRQLCAALQFEPSRQKILRDLEDRYKREGIHAATPAWYHHPTWAYWYSTSTVAYQYRLRTLVFSHRTEHARFIEDLESLGLDQALHEPDISRVTASSSASSSSH